MQGIPSYQDYLEAREADEALGDHVATVEKLMSQHKRGMITNREVLEQLALVTTEALLG